MKYLPVTIVASILLAYLSVRYSGHYSLTTSHKNSIIFIVTSTPYLFLRLGLKYPGTKAMDFLVKLMLGFGLFYFCAVHIGMPELIPAMVVSFAAPLFLRFDGKMNPRFSPFIPKRAFFETMVVPYSAGVVTNEVMLALRGAIKNQLTVLSSDACRTIPFGTNGLALSDSKGQFYIWATLSNEVTNIRIDINYAELNRGRWRTKSESNWDFNHARDKDDELRRGSGHDDLVLLGCLLYIVHLFIRTKLSQSAADEAQGLRQTFMTSLALAVDAWSDGFKTLSIDKGNPTKYMGSAHRDFEGRLLIE